MTSTLQLESITRTIQYRDPILLFHHLVREGSNGLLLESAEVDSKRHLQSFLMVSAALRISCHGRKVIIQSLTENGRRMIAPFARQLAASGTVEPVINDDGDSVEVTYPPTCLLYTSPSPRDRG